MRVGIGRGRGSLVRPASDRRGSNRGWPERRAARAEASVVPPRMRMRMSAFLPKSEPESSTASPPPWLTILGIGEDGREGLSPAARAALDRAEFVAGGARHLALAGPLAAQT